VPTPLPVKADASICASVMMCREAQAAQTNRQSKAVNAGLKPELQKAYKQVGKHKYKASR